MKKTISVILAALMIISMVLMTSCSAPQKYTIGVQSGTTGWSFIAGDADWGFTGFKNVKLNSFDNAALAVSDLLAGNTDFVVVDDAVAKTLVANNAGTKCIDIPLTTESYGIAVDKNQSELLTKINAFLAAKSADIEALFDKYADVNDDNSASWTGDVVSSAEYDATKDQLVVATNAAFAPFEFVVGNGYAGIDMEMAKMLADYLEMELVIVNMEFDAITASLGNNGVDIGIAAMTINANRAKIVNFSDSYYTDAYQVIICKEADTTFDGCTTTEQVLDILNSLENK
jgi:polar amino acid transport system substrate-binding protein